MKGSAQDLLNASQRSAQAKAAEFLTTFLADGPQPHKEVKAAAEALGHSGGTIRLVQRKLGIKSQNNGKNWD